MKSVMVFGLVCVFSSSVFAMPPYLAKFKATYPAASALAKCTVCHNGTGYKDRNDFAKDFAANAHDFKAIEGFDSDVDGFTNIAEITAGTLPGSADSHPAQ
jgi:hypothetical protein